MFCSLGRFQISTWAQRPWAPFASVMCLIVALTTSAHASDCYPMDKESAQLGRYLVYKSTYADGREVYSTRAAVAPNSEGGLIWCVYNGRPGDDTDPSSVIATDANGVTLWMRRLDPVRKGSPVKTLSEQDFRDAMRGLGTASYLYRAPQASAHKVPSHVVTVDRSCKGDVYIIQTTGRRSIGGTERQRHEKDARLKALGMLEIQYWFRGDGVLLNDRRRLDAGHPSGTELVEEGEWDRPSCIEAVG